MSEFSLYQINQMERDFLDNVSDGKVPESAIPDTLELFQITKSDKAVSCIMHHQNEKRIIESIDDEIKRLQRVKKVRENRLKNFEKYLVKAMEISNQKTIETSLGRITLVKNTKGKVNVVDVKKVPQQYTIIKQEVVADKKSINEAFQRGEVVSGCTFLKGSHIRIG